MDDEPLLSHCHCFTIMIPWVVHLDTLKRTVVDPIQVAILESFPTKPLDLEITPTHDFENNSIANENDRGWIASELDVHPHDIFALCTDSCNPPVTPPWRFLPDISETLQSEAWDFSPLKRSGPRLRLGEKRHSDHRSGEADNLDPDEQNPRFTVRSPCSSCFLYRSSLPS